MSYHRRIVRSLPSHLSCISLFFFHEVKQLMNLRDSKGWTIWRSLIFPFKDSKRRKTKELENWTTEPVLYSLWINRETKEREILLFTILNHKTKRKKEEDSENMILHSFARRSHNCIPLVSEFHCLRLSVEPIAWTTERTKLMNLFLSLTVSFPPLRSYSLVNLYYHQLLHSVRLFHY